jgi:hypothetical protein
LGVLPQCGKKFFMAVLEQEYKDEINGIVEGLHARK